MSVGQVLLQILCDPTEHLIRRWNWKSALFSPVLRALIFFFANLTAGWRAALMREPAAGAPDFYLVSATGGSFAGSTPASAKSWSASSR